MQNESDFQSINLRSISQFTSNIYIETNLNNSSKKSFEKTKIHSSFIENNFSDYSEEYKANLILQGDDPYNSSFLKLESNDNKENKGNNNNESNENNENLYNISISNEEELIPAELFEMPNPNIMVSKIFQDVITMETQRNKELWIAKTSDNYKKLLQSFQRTYGGPKKWKLVIYAIEELQTEFQSLVCILFWILLEKLQRRAIVYCSNEVDLWSLDDKFAEIWTQITLRLPTEGSNESFSSDLSYADFVHFLSLLLFRLFLYNFPEDAINLHKIETRKWIISEINQYIFGRGGKGELHSDRPGKAASNLSTSFQSTKGSGFSSTRPSGRTDDRKTVKSDKGYSSRSHSTLFQSRRNSKADSFQSRRNSKADSFLSSHKLDNSFYSESQNIEKKLDFIPQTELFLLQTNIRFLEAAEFKLDDINAILDELEKASQQPSVRMDLKMLRKAHDSETQQKKQLLKRLEGEHKDLLAFSAEGMSEELDSIDQLIVIEKAQPLNPTQPNLNSRIIRKAKPSAEEDIKKKINNFLQQRKTEKAWYERGKGSDFKIKKPKPSDIKGFYTCATELRTGPLIRKYLHVLHEEQRISKQEEKEIVKDRLRLTPTPTLEDQPQIPLDKTLYPNETFFITGAHTSYNSNFNSNYNSTEHVSTLYTPELEDLEEDEGYVESFSESNDFESNLDMFD